MQTVEMLNQRWQHNRRPISIQPDLFSTRECAKCHRIQPLFDFDIGKNGYIHWECKECRRARIREAHQQNKEKYALLCKQSVQRHKTRRQLKTKEYRRRNYTRLQQEALKYREAHREELRAQNSAYYHAHPEQVKRTFHNRNARLKDAKGKLTGPQWLWILAYFNNRCGYCLAEYPPEKLTPDHMMPLSRGGDNLWTNIIPACPDCNLSKGAKTPLEFLNYQVNIQGKP